MHSPDLDKPPHEHPAVQALLRDCPWLVDRLDLSEGVHYVMNQVALLLRGAELPDAEMNCLFLHLNKMANGDTETQNILVVGVLEVLTDTPASIERARAGLDGGPARFLFERVLKGWDSVS